MPSEPKFIRTIFGAIPPTIQLSISEFVQRAKSRAKTPLTGTSVHDASPHQPCTCAVFRTVCWNPGGARARLGPTLAVDRNLPRRILGLNLFLNYPKSQSQNHTKIDKRLWKTCSSGALLEGRGGRSLFSVVSDPGGAQLQKLRRNPKNLQTSRDMPQTGRFLNPSKPLCAWNGEFMVRFPHTTHKPQVQCFSKIGDPPIWIPASVPGKSPPPPAWVRRPQADFFLSPPDPPPGGGLKHHPAPSPFRLHFSSRPRPL